MLKKACLLVISSWSINFGFAQSTFIPLGSQDYDVLDRLETRSGRLCDSLALGDRPESRRNAVHFLESVGPSYKEVDIPPPSTINTHGYYVPARLSEAIPGMKGLSGIDQYNIAQMISENGEWTQNGNGAISSKHSWFNTFYTKQYDFAYVKTNNFFLVANPVFNGTAIVQHNDPAAPSAISNSVFTTSYGAELRGWVAKKIGFYTSITDNQEHFPYYVYTLASSPGRQAVPGGGYFLNSSPNNYNYLQATGYINFDVIKNYVNLTFGEGKHFIGDGISSMFLTDYSSNMPYLQLQARIWKINYECLYLELTPQYNSSPGSELTHKFSTIHYLTWNTFKWLNLGFFEAEVFDRPNVYEISYLNPIIFSDALNRYNGEGDKSVVGMSAKIIAAKHLQFYGQLMFNEFRSSELFGNKGWFGNKWGVQMGAKYFDAFSVRNLELQVELDAVRPYTYSAKDTLANYTNYNQPLADPLGSGFIKAIGVIKYQPVKNLYLSVTGTYYIHGADTGSVNNGNDIFQPYLTAESQYGVSLVNGPKNHCLIINPNISYQLRRNLFIDAGGVYRKYTDDATLAHPEYSTTGPVYGPLTTTYVYFGIRINASRRDYTFF